MNPTPNLDCVFPLSTGSSERARLRAPSLLSGLDFAPGSVLEDFSFMRDWASRRVEAARASCAVPVNNHGHGARAM
jgi:hypothetical protein